MLSKIREEYFEEQARLLSKYPYPDSQIQFFAIQVLVMERALEDIMGRVPVLAGAGKYTGEGITREEMRLRRVASKALEKIQKIRSQK